ncbi:MAG: TIGR02530 family flagellar biosynthesis protein [Bdellovibrionota bacterium]
MALEKMTGAAAGINPIRPNEGQGPGGVASKIKDGADFRKALDQFSGAMPTAPSVGAQALTKPGQTPGAASLKFSNHAIERMHSRGISYTPETMKNIETAVAKAAAKGSKDTLVLTGDSALIVSVKNNTVVTVMDKNAMKENVFTNIDSTVMA